MTDDRQSGVLFESWLKDTDPMPADARPNVARVMARVPQTRQRGRWWPLPSFHRKAQSRTATDTTDYQPSPVPATNGHAPAVIGRTQIMFSPVKLITAGALIFAIGGVLLIAQPFDQQGSVPGAEQGAEPASTTPDVRTPAEVTGVIKEVRRNQPSEVVQSPTEFTSSPFVTVTTNFGYTMLMETDDPRLSGTYETNQTSQQYGTTGGVRTGIGRLANEGGSWASEFRGLSALGGVTFVHFLTGEGGYEGVSAMLLTLPAESGWEVTGFVAPDPLPAPPEWVLPPTE